VGKERATTRRVRSLHSDRSFRFIDYCYVLSTADAICEPFQGQEGALPTPKCWDLPGRGRVRVVRPCDGPGGGPVLRYGQTWRGGPFRCKSLTTGLYCRSVLSGHGFYLSREFQRTF